MKNQNEQNVISDAAVERLKAELTSMTDEQELLSMRKVIQDAKTTLELCATRCQDKGWMFKTVQPGVEGAHIGAYLVDASAMVDTALLKLAGDLAAIEKEQYSR